MASQPAPIALLPAPDVLAGTSLSRDAWRRLKRNRMAMAGLFVTVTLTLSAFVGPLIVHAVWGYDYESQDLAYGARPPTLAHWFGTDYFGRDLLTRVMFGSQI